MLRRTEIANFNHLAVKKVTASYTVMPTDEFLEVDATAAAVTITIPDAVGNANLTLYIKKIDSSGNAVTVQSAVSGQTIDGNSSVSISSQWATLTVTSDGTNYIEKTVTSASTFTGGTIANATTVNNTLTVNTSSATAFVVGPNGTTNPVLTVITNVASQAAGISITGNAAGSGVVITVTSSGSNESLILTAKGTGAVRVTPGSDSTNTFQVTNAANSTSLLFMNASTAVGGTFADWNIKHASATSLTAGPNSTNYTLQVDSSTASAATGLKIKSAAAAAGLAISVISSGTDEALTIDAKGAGTITIGATSTGNVTLGSSSNLVNFGQSTIALGGGSAPTLGTIGATGPATAGQNSWLKVNINGTASFLPVWR